MSSAGASLSQQQPRGHREVADETEAVESQDILYNACFKWRLLFSIDTRHQASMKLTASQTSCFIHKHNFPLF